MTFKIFDYFQTIAKLKSLESLKLSMEDMNYDNELFDTGVGYKDSKVWLETVKEITIGTKDSIVNFLKSYINGYIDPKDLEISVATNMVSGIAYWVLSPAVFNSPGNPAIFRALFPGGLVLPVLTQFPAGYIKRKYTETANRMYGDQSLEG